MLKTIVTTLIVLMSGGFSAAFARDDGGFGASFTGRQPSALSVSPNSQIAQTSIYPTDAESLQLIMPAAGEEDATSAAEASDSAQSLKPEEGSNQK